MNKKELKRYIAIAFIILIILLSCFLLIKQYFTSKKYVVSLLNKGDKNVNYSVSYNNDELIDYVKGFEEKLIFSNGKIYYANYEEGKSILIDPENKTIELNSVENKNGPHRCLYVKDINRMSFEYENNKNVNNNECVVIKLSDNENSNVNYLTKRLYINRKLGIVEKIEMYKSTVYGNEDFISKQLYNMHTGVVTDQDIEKPDLNKYSDYTIIEN